MTAKPNKASTKHAPKTPAKPHHAQKHDKKKPTTPHFYGIHAVKALLSMRPYDAKALFVQSYDNHTNHTNREHEDIISLAKSVGVSIQSAHKDTLSQLCGSTQHQGVVLSARARTLLDEQALDELMSDDGVFLILDQITDPHNFGAILRTSSAMEVSAVIVPRHQSVGITPTVAKVSVGGSESVPVVMVTNLARCIQTLKDQGVFVFGTALDDTAAPLQECDFGGKVAIIMGSEGEGLRRLTGELCDTLVYIPMSDDPHRPQSLNVSVATGMVLWEVMRQKSVIGSL